MFGISWYEMAVISVIALIVIGPKDLPRILRTLGQWMGKAQRLANEFRRGLDQMAKESGVDEVKRQVEKAASLHPANQVKKAVLGTGTAASAPAASPAPAPTNGTGATATAPETTRASGA
ncbi:MAG: twin-arginine translocase subunit TatB [Alphaproteobacteria bacterium]|nr:twin-arginine translocase subunit TatB [Alphaproteobacteria bacterium]